MPEMPPPPWMPASPSSSCMRKPASVENSSHGAPRSMSSATRSARQKLVAGAEALAPGIGKIPNLLLERAEIPDQRQHLLAVGAKGLGALISAALDDRHGNSVAQGLGRPRHAAETSESEGAAESVDEFGSPGRIRTSDRPVNSHRGGRFP